uniref:Uncharacterized protein n=1 Tax=Anguilla anguilla TaxID=7936 RepID=A0A0E9WL66_ANGAN
MCSWATTSSRSSRTASFRKSRTPSARRAGRPPATSRGRVPWTRELPPTSEIFATSSFSAHCGSHRACTMPLTPLQKARPQS